MKLHEIVKIPPIADHGIKFSNIDMDHGPVAFKVDGHPVYQHQEVGGTSGLFALKIDGVDAAYVVHGYMTLHGSTYPYLTRAVTATQFKGKGYAMKIIVQLRNLYNQPMLSDEQLTPDGIDMWKRLAAVLPVKVYDFTNGTTLPITDVADSDLYTDATHNKHVFIIEQLSALHNNQTTTSRVHEGIITPYSYIMLEGDDTLALI
jgi:hypothetical protein